ncbi:unnamed protein product [Adineta steineri]|uniref:DUF7789 domain-containing protein n=1 Tax=Adineta steineri TaxID=433720 RepID=A0A818X608_9BILA|nr:unnamed protein product [Adineta steineri]CAF3734387.1 unnamed protein product [Adineta steineri]
MLTISSLILNIPNEEDFGLYHIIILSVGIPFTLLWCAIGILMSIYKNCLWISLFYFLSIIQPFHLIHLIYISINKFYGLLSENEINQYYPLFIIIFVCVSANCFVQLFTTIIGCWMISKTDRTIFDTRWIVASI